MEEDLSKTFEGQGRLGRAKDRLDTRVAEIGQAEIDRANDEQKIDKAQDDIGEGVVPETMITAPMDQGSPVPSTPRDVPEPDRFDISSRPATPKRRIDEDDMEDESQDKKPRPRSATISYRTDAESVGSQMDFTILA